MRFSVLLCVFVFSMFTSTAQVKMKKTVSGVGVA